MSNYEKYNIMVYEIIRQAVVTIWNHSMTGDAVLQQNKLPFDQLGKEIGQEGCLGQLKASLTRRFILLLTFLGCNKL